MRRFAQKLVVKLALFAGFVGMVGLAVNPTLAASGSSNKIREVKVVEDGGKTTITVVGSQRPSFTAFRLKSPRRLVIDIADSQIRGVPSIIDKETGVVDGVAVSQYSVKGVPVSRVMVNFKDDAAYRIRVQGNDLVASLNGAPSQSAATRKVRSEVAVAQSEASEAMRLREEAQADLMRLKAESEKRRAEADEAEKRRKQALADLENLKSQSASSKKEAQRAQKEAQDAMARLSEAQALQKKQQVGKLDNARGEIERARKLVETYQAKAAQADQLAKEEKLKRLETEKHLAVLEAQLHEKIEEVGRAEKSLASAGANAMRLKRDAHESTRAYETAKKEASTALLAEQAAAIAYRKAAQGEREELLAVLKQREAQTRDAEQKLEATNSSKKEIEEELNKALTALREATSQARGRP